MKNKLLILAMGFALTTQMVMAQVPSYIPSNGLVVYYPFTGNANEVLQNSNNGIINGATLTSDKNGLPNNAYNFNGINNYIDLPSNFYGGQNASIVSFCLRFKVNINGDYFIWNKDGSWLEAGIFTRANGKFGIFWAFLNQYNGIETSTGTILPNTWYDAVIIINGVNSKIYLNGVEQINLTINNPSNSIGFGDTGTCGIGINRFGYKKTSCIPGEYFNGVLDEFYFYDRIITPNEITSIYNSSQISTYTDTCNNVSGSLTQGLVGYWPFCGNANDDSGNGNNGTVNGATLTTDRFGNANSAYQFIANTDYINGIANGLNNSRFSVSLWVWIEGMNNTTLNCFKFSSIPEGSTDGGYRIYSNLNGQELGVQMANGTNVITSNYLNNNLQNWHHVVGVYDLNKLKLYVDGILRNTILVSNYNINYINQNFYIGNNGNTNNSNLNLRKLDDIGIWNRALTQQEITQLYNQNQCITNITVTDTLIINVGQMSYTNPVAFANNITIYPNPASTQINISFNNITDLTGGNIHIINSLGQQVASTPITLTGTSTTMALNTWGGNGIYFVQILNAQGQIVDIKKIILQ